MATKKKKGKKSKEDINVNLSKLLICIIVVLISLIYVNFGESNRSNFKKYVLDETINYQKFNAIYEKVIGKIKPSKKEEMVFSENLKYENIVKEGNSYKLTVLPETMIPVLDSGIIVFIGEKENLGKTVIIQGNDGVDIWYSNIEITDNSLYDYVSVGDVLGVSNGTEIYLTFLKGKEYISYEKYIK